MIPTTFFRSSSIREFCDCKMRYFANYCLGLRQPSGPAALLGTAFHLVMEVLANCKMDLQSDSPKYQYYDKETGCGATYKTIEDVNVEELTKCVYDQMINSIDIARVPPSYHRKTELGSKKAWLPYKKLKDSVTNVFQMGPRSFDVRKMHIVATEQKFDIEIREPWARYNFDFRGRNYKGYLRIRGSIDLIVQNEDGTMSIIDWKTGVTANMSTGIDKEYEDFAGDLQMSMYYLATRRYLGFDVSDVTLCFPNENKVFTLYFDEDLVLDRIRSIYEEMKNTPHPTKTESQFCKLYCPYFKQSFHDVKTKPLVKAKDYYWEEDGEIVQKSMRICNQLEKYFLAGFTPLEVMNALARYNHKVELYTNW